MKVLIVANRCGDWTSWPAKKQAIQKFFSPLVDLEIDIIPGYYTNIPYTGGPGTITTFGPHGATDMPGTEIEIDDKWIFNAIVSVALPYDICIFQTTGIFKPGMPLGLFVGSRSGVRICETFVNNENDHYYASINGQMVDYGNLAETIIKHEISHALYDMAHQQDRTHEFFYSGQFDRILTDIHMPSSNLLISLYKQVIPLLQQWYSLLLKQKPMPTPQNPDFLYDDWTDKEKARHNVRAICDQELLSFDQKQRLTACVKQESDFDIKAYNHNANGTDDWGLCQYNTGTNQHGMPYWIGPGATFQDVNEVLTNPEKCVRVMARYYKATGNLNPWVSWSSGAYKKWLGKV